MVELCFYSLSTAPLTQHSGRRRVYTFTLVAVLVAPLKSVLLWTAFKRVVDRILRGNVSPPQCIISVANLIPPSHLEGSTTTECNPFKQIVL